MHSIMIIGGGLLLLGIFLLAARLFGGDHASMARAVLTFIPVWLVCAGINMYIGVVKAGYTIMQELPFFVLVFGVPTAVALLARWLIFKQ